MNGHSAPKAARPRPLRTQVLIAALGAAIAGAVAVTVAYLHFDNQVDVYSLISDPAPYVDMPWYFGMLSHAGVMLWIASAAISALAAATLWHSQERRHQHLSHFLAAISLATLWMAIDDLLLVHEQLGQLVLGRESRHAGEGAMFAAYAVVMFGVVVWYRETLAHTQLVLLVAATCSLAISIAIDILIRLDFNGGNPLLDTVLARSWGEPVSDIVEDSLKLYGGMLLLAYLFRTSYLAMRQEIAGLNAAPFPAPSQISDAIQSGDTAPHPGALNTVTIT